MKPSSFAGSRAGWMGLILLGTFSPPLPAAQLGEFTYRLIDGGAAVEITDYPTSATGVIEVPAEIEGKPVTRIGKNAFMFCSHLTGIVLPESLTAIGDRAFGYCKQLAEITLPENLTTIGDSAFWNCRQLPEITLPAAVVELGNTVFDGCTGLLTIDVAPDNPAYASVEGVLLDHARATLIRYPAGRAGPYVIPDGVTEIGQSAFEDAAGLTELTLAASVARLGVDAFKHCAALARLEVAPGNPDYASLDGVLVDPSQTVLLQYPPGRAGSYTVPPGIVRVARSAFQDCSGLTVLDFSATVTQVDSFAFYNCPQLTQVTIPATLTSIGHFAFTSGDRLLDFLVEAGNPEYAEVEGVLFNAARTELIAYPSGRSGSYPVPAGTTTIGMGAFDTCEHLTAVTLPDSLTAIGRVAFAFCPELRAITFPPGLQQINDSAFAWSALETAVFQGAAPELGRDVFDRVSQDFQIWFPTGAPGFSSPTWEGYPASPYETETHPAASWLLAHGLSADTPLDQDLNGDGVSLGMAYALNLDPNQDLRGRLPRPVLGPATLELSFYAARPGVIYHVETSVNLRAWTTTGVALSGPAERRTAAVPRDGAYRFLRLRVEFEAAP